MDTLSATTNIFDTSGLAALKRQASVGDPAANKAIAKQFEALFWQMALKSMRDATPGDGLFDSDQTRMYQSLLDQQLSQSLSSSGRGTGLAALIEAQLARRDQPLPDDAPPLLPAASAMSPVRNIPVRSGISPSAAVPPVRSEGSPLGAPTFSPASFSTDPPPVSASDARRAFVDRLAPAAAAAAQRTGIPAHFMVAQAALETGWGKSEPRLADGRPSFNLFGIKAGSTWRGATTDAATTEVVAGVAQQRVERFRAYASYDAAFQDYADLLTRNQRYAAVLGAQQPAGFARGLQAAGFATDPQYAAKLERIIGGMALRQAMRG
jgi:flagellar protein FlgJ